MPIEIKELRIKVNVIDASEEGYNLNQKSDPVKIQELKSEIIGECIQKVLEKIKEKSER